MVEVFLGTDHRGFELKEKIAQWLLEEGYKFTDEGAHSCDQNDDYTSYAQKVASLVAADAMARGILLCGSGAGVDITANKFDRVRACTGLCSEQIASARKHDDLNVLVIAADHTDDDLALGMVEAFLETEYDHLERHQRRLDEIRKIESNQ